jgi:hypothetical protein
MAEINVAVSTSEVNELLEESYKIMKSINKNLEAVKTALQFFEDSDVIKGKAADSIKDFIGVINEEVIDQSIEFNDKLFKSLKTISHQFDTESFIELS